MRTEDDLGMGIVVVGLDRPRAPHHGPAEASRTDRFPGSLVMGLLVVVFGFFFVTVSSRIVGIIGTSSNPISGMTIATLMATCVVFVAIGRTGDVYQAVALCVGALVCIAAANAGATSQDLKTGFLVGATPRKQQIGFIIGVLVSTLVIGGTLFLLDSTYREPGRWPTASAARSSPAPQAHADGDDHQGPARPEPAVGSRARRRLPRVHGADGRRARLSWAVGAYLPALDDHSRS